MSNPTDSPAAWVARCALISDNRITFDTWRSMLPNPPEDPAVVESRADGVYVFVADLDDLAAWFEAVGGGVVERGPVVFAGMRPWTLTVDTGPDFRGLIVHVSVLAMGDAQAMWFLDESANRLVRPLAQSPMAVPAAALGGAS